LKGVRDGSGGFRGSVLLSGWVGLCRNPEEDRPFTPGQGFSDMPGMEQLLVLFSKVDWVVFLSFPFFS
jgi:hypothetical protein